MAEPVTNTATATVLVIGIGARHRGDDEIGLLAVQSLADNEDLQGVRFASHSDDPARIISEWEGEDSVIVIDAVRTGSEPGTLHHIDVSSTEIAPRSRQSSHGNALADAIELSRALGRLPERLIVLGIEPSTTGLGDELSEVYRDALPVLVETALKEIRCMNRQ